MSGFDPDAYLAKATREPPRASSVFDPDAYLAQQTKGAATAPGSPLERALAEQSGDVVTVDTPTGPAKFTRAGDRFFDPEESRQFQKAADAKLKERALEGGLSFLSGGGSMLDEMAGARAAVNPGLRPGEILPAYRKARDGARADVDRSTRNASPNVRIAGADVPVLPMLGAALPSMAAPVPLGAIPRILSAGAQGALGAAGSSQADLTRGEAGDFAKDVGVGGGVGLGAAGLAEGMSAPLRWLSARATSEAGAARQAAIAAEQALKDKALKSATGAMGGVAAGGANSIEKMEQVLASPHDYSPAVVAEAQAMRALPQTQDAMNRAAAGNLDKLKRFIPDYEAAEIARNEAAAAASPATVEAGVEAKLDPQAILKDVGGKAWKSLGQRAVLGAAGSAVGSGFDKLTGNDSSDPGMKYGGLAGLLAGPGAVQFMRNQAASPLVQSGANRLVSSLLTGTSSGLTKLAPLAQPVADQTSRARLTRAYKAMMEKYGLEKPDAP